MHQFTDSDVQSAEEVDGDVRLNFNFDHLACIYLSKEDLLHLLKLIEEEG